MLTPVGMHPVCDAIRRRQMQAPGYDHLLSGVCRLRRTSQSLSSVGSDGSNESCHTAGLPAARPGLPVGSAGSDMQEPSVVCMTGNPTEGSNERLVPVPFCAFEGAPCGAVI